MAFHTLDDITANELIPGFRGKFIHTEGVTVAHWDIDAGAELPEHAHPQAQITLLLAGRFELTVAGETRLIEAGAFAVIPGDVPHAGKALTACRIMDVFHPARPEYRNR